MVTSVHELLKKRTEHQRTGYFRLNPRVSQPILQNLHETRFHGDIAEGRFFPRKTQEAIVTAPLRTSVCGGISVEEMCVFWGKGSTCFESERTSWFGFKVILVMVHSGVSRAIAKPLA